ncbi:MAG: signal peptidase II [Chloroflexota bacterium]
MQTADAAEAPARPRPRFSPGRYVFWLAAVLVVALDQITKAIVRSTLDVGERWPTSGPVYFRYVTNTGAAFGSLQNATTLLIGMTFIGLAAIYLYYRNPPFQHWIASVAIGMMLGGAIGNLIDRVRVGRVTDFAHLFPHFPNFNVADSSISIGVTIIIIGYLLFGEQQKPKPAPAPETHADPPADV